MVVPSSAGLAQRARARALLRLAVASAPLSAQLARHSRAQRAHGLCGVAQLAGPRCPLCLLPRSERRLRLVALAPSDGRRASTRARLLGVAAARTEWARLRQRALTSLWSSGWLELASQSPLTVEARVGGAADTRVPALPRGRR
eukprot:scaffold1605_cov340-Prasinococcus_capsulatus_cf.AAC.10